MTDIIQGMANKCNQLQTVGQKERYRETRQSQSDWSSRQVVDNVEGVRGSEKHWAWHVATLHFIANWAHHTVFIWS